MSYKLIRNCCVSSLVVILLCGGLITYMITHRVSSYDQLLTENQSYLQSLRELESRLHHLIIGVQQAVLESRWENETLLAQIDGVLSGSQEMTAGLQTSTREPLLGSVVDFQEQLQMLKVALINYSLELRYDPAADSTTGLENILMGVGKRADALFRGLAQEGNQNIQHAHKMLGTHAARARTLSTYGLIFGVGFGILVAVILARTLGAPIKELIHATEELARGNYQYRIPIRSRDEIGRLAGSFNAMSATLQKAENQRAHLEKQLRQAEKVEAIGRLAGGVAHDLNNMLAPILGYSEMLMEDFSAGDIRRKSVKEISQAATRARDLVRQLLAFSRKQTFEFQPLDLNAVIEEFNPLLKRTIREDIEMVFELSPDIQPIKADLSQIDQIIMNLAVNAADAMPDGGTMIIETSPALLDRTYADTHPGVNPGEFVQLTVSDTGSGMDEATQAQIFEPFFSTKGEQGTGLGLATVYGIVKQHGGNVWVYSEPGMGTTFKVYLPVTGEALAGRQADPPNGAELKGREKILLVEDNPQVRQLASDILVKQGYEIVAAEDGNQALSLLTSHRGSVDLLLTDVVMPDMNGKALYGKVSEAYPDIRVLYMSGYTSNVITDRGVLDEGVQFVQKPFSVQGLAAKVRHALDQGA